MAHTSGAEAGQEWLRWHIMANVLARRCKLASCKYFHISCLTIFCCELWQLFCLSARINNLKSCLGLGCSGSSGCSGCSWHKRGAGAGAGAGGILVTLLTARKVLPNGCHTLYCLMRHARACLSPGQAKPVAKQKCKHAAEDSAA